MLRPQLSCQVDVHPSTGTCGTDQSTLLPWTSLPAFLFPILPTLFPRIVVHCAPPVQFGLAEVPIATFLLVSPPNLPHGPFSAVLLRSTTFLLPLTGSFPPTLTLLASRYAPMLPECAHLFQNFLSSLLASFEIFKFGGGDFFFFFFFFVFPFLPSLLHLTLRPFFHCQ